MTITNGHRDGTKIASIKTALDAILVKNNGVLTPESVVEAAKNKGSVLHDQFTWDNNKAAHNYRLLQAMCLIKSVRIRVSEGEESMRTHAYVLPERGKSEYRALTDVLSDKDLSEALLEQAKAELSAFKLKYGRIQRLASLMPVIEEVLAQ